MTYKWVYFVSYYALSASEAREYRGNIEVTSSRPFRSMADLAETRGAIAEKKGTPEKNVVIQNFILLRKEKAVSR